MISAGTRLKTQFLLSVAVCWGMDVVGELRGSSFLLPLAVSTLVWVVAGLGGWVLLTGGQQILRRIRLRIPAPVLNVGATTLFSAGIGVYLLDWAVFRQTGIFVEWESLEFIRSNSRELLYDIAEVQSRDLLTLLYTTMILSAGVLWLAAKAAPWFQKIEARISLKRTLLFLVGVGLSASLFAYGAVGGTGLLSAAQHAAGPAAAFLVGGFEHLAYFHWVQPDKSQCASVLFSDAKKIISMDTYLHSQPPLKQPPCNVIYISIESLRADRLKCLGAKREIMPFLDRLAVSSVVFSNAYSESTHTSFAETTAVTSQYPLQGNRADWSDVPIASRGVMLSNVLKALGYRTALFASQNMNWGGQRTLLKTGGLDTLVDAENPEKGYAEKNSDPEQEKIPMEGSWEITVPDRATLEAASAWARQNPRRPFFLYLNLQHSHFPYTLPAGVAPVFSPNKIDFPISFARYPRDKTQVMMNRYDNSLHYIDSLLEKFFDQLKASGQYDHTIVVISGDHGEAFYEHNFVTHGSDPYNELLRIPLIVHAPGLAPWIDPEPVQHIDIAPSVLHLLGLSPHTAFQGRDFFQAGKFPDRAIFSVVDTPFSRSMSLIQGRYKLISNWKNKTYALFDLENDPGERRNIFMEDPAVARRLLKTMNFWTLCQVTYYDDPQVNSRYYPPTYDFSGSPSKS